MSFKTICRRANRYIAPAAVVFYLLAIVAVVIHFIAVSSTAFAEAFNSTFAAAVRALLAWITNLWPVSLAETLLLASPFIMTALVVYCIRVSGRSARSALRYIINLFSVAALIYALFIFGFGTGYNTRTLDLRIGLERSDVSADELYYTADKLAGQINEIVPQVDYIYSSSSVMPYDVGEMNAKLLEAYDDVCGEYTFVSRLNSRVKPIVLSEPMTYTHISGVYSFFTGEANLNTNYPDYILPYTAAHELAHQRGIARENEANFVAFLVCVASQDEYVRYSALLNMFEYVTNALYSADKTLYYQAVSSLDTRARYELQAYAEFFDAYRDNTAATVTNAINDTYLVIQGTPGTKSYGMVVDLTVAYYLSMGE